MQVSSDSEVKRKIELKSGKEIILQINHSHKHITHDKLAFVCKRCGWEKPFKTAYLKSPHTPVICPKCKSRIDVEVVKNLATDRFSTNLDNLQIRDKTETRRLK
jgi:Zn finger protein HypA/HybF involved in hydrogenase expression